MKKNPFFFIECFEEIKSQFFTGSDDEGYEPFCGMVSVANGTAFAIGQLFAASFVHSGPGPGFLVPWVYAFIVGGIQEVVKNLPSGLNNGSLYCDMYEKVHINSNFAVNI